LDKALNLFCGVASKALERGQECDGSGALFTGRDTSRVEKKCFPQHKSEE